MGETRAAPKHFAKTSAPFANRSCAARAQDRTRLELTAIALASAVALLVGCGGADPATSTPATTAALGTPESSDMTAPGVPAPQGATIYLSDLRQVPSFNGNEFNQGVVGAVGGRDFSRSLRTRFCKNRGQAAMFKLREPYSSFIATVGLDDRSDPSASVQFNVSVGDKVVFQEQAGMGQAIVVDVPVRDSNILTLSATLLSANSPCAAVAIWGEARVER